MDDTCDYAARRFLDELSKIQVHRSARFGAALKKPLLLLLLISKIEHGEAKSNRFQFAMIRDELAALIERHGGRLSKAGAKPEQPFSHLRSSRFWVLTLPRQYASGETVLISDLLDRGTFGSFDHETFALLAGSAEVRRLAFQRILDQWWPETLHDEVREDLGMPSSELRKSTRAVEFVVEVLQNYRYSCAFCGFHALINGRSIGVDACHIKWHSAHGPDTAQNGIALCKLHHWAFDKGVMAVDEQLRLRVARPFVVRVSGGLPLESLDGKRLSVLPLRGAPDRAFLAWHRNNIYLS